jgi:hypothetical protein
VSIITPYYKDQIKTLHEMLQTKQRRWGSTSARNFGDEIKCFLTKKNRVRSLLDFGSGQSSMKGFLEENLPKKQLDMLEIVEYDPGIPGKDILPDRDFEMIISSDVLEHVEPECIDETIAWMQAHTTRFLYHHIACDPAGINLPDGRNVHLITEDLAWWMKKFTHPDWQWMEARDCWQQKRKYFRRHVHIRLDKNPAGGPIVKVPGGPEAPF